MQEFLTMFGDESGQPTRDEYDPAWKNSYREVMKKLIRNFRGRDADIVQFSRKFEAGKDVLYANNVGAA